MELKVTEHSDGKEIKLAVGQPFTIVLPESPTTGYVWHFTKDGTPICLLVRDSFQASSHLVGASGVHEWLFHTASRGRVTLKMRLARQWEQNTVRQSFQLLVDVT
jgi:predicted secreted protein